MNNSAEDNTIVVYKRNGFDGTLEYMNSVSTGGQGSGIESVPGPGAGTIDPLASNYAVVMSDNNRALFAVNAGSNEVSSFSVKRNADLKLMSTLDSGGENPVSVATTGNVVYVMNVNEGQSSLQGFVFNRGGKLTPLPDSARDLTGRATAIRFSEDGKHLIAAEVNTQRLQVFARDGRYLSEEATTFEYPTPAEGRNVPNPFGIETFKGADGQYLVVGEARVFTQDGENDIQGGSVSTFKIAHNGELDPISLDVSNGGSLALCWVVFNEFTNRMFTANTASDTISNYYSTASGEANLTSGVAFQEDDGQSGAGLTDLFTTSKYVYQLYSAEGTVVTLAIKNDGSLVEVDRDTDLAAIGGNQGITGF
ncbi:lactonase family protein [Enterovibrio calviensis]|uniref:beta-propeller fold lactonase family protein n=1 Tax=Enterovibrio calviensis TaxID=91359 RepID=UPI00138DECB0|nr:beta-propeller fold lactonase family protein [Enterovibrio calviensis]